MKLPGSKQTLKFPKCKSVVGSTSAGTCALLWKTVQALASTAMVTSGIEQGDFRHEQLLAVAVTYICSFEINCC